MHIILVSNKMATAKTITVTPRLVLMAMTAFVVILLGLSSLFSYLTWQSSRWSPEQAEAIAMAFRFDAPEPGDSAETLRISRQAFSARLDGAGYAPLWDAEQAFKNDAKD